MNVQALAEPRRGQGGRGREPYDSKWRRFAALPVKTLTNLFALVAFRENLHWIKSTATAALFDLNGGQRTIGAGHIGFVRCHLFKSSLAPFERCFEIFRFHGPRAVMSGAFLDYFHFGVWQMRQHVSRLVADVLGSQVTGH